MRIELLDISKRYGNNWIVRKVNTVFESGLIYGIQGPNGSGKSTLLKMLAAYLSPSYGQILYTNSKGKVLDREIVYSYLNMAAPYVDLQEVLSVRESIDFQRQLKTFKSGWDTEQLLDFAYLTAFDNHALWELSSGMLQRLKLALAMCSETELLILDEPGTNLDVKARQWYLEALRLLAEEKTVLIASNEIQDFPTGARYFQINDWK